MYTFASLVENNYVRRLRASDRPPARSCVVHSSSSVGVAARVEAGREPWRERSPYTKSVVTPSAYGNFSGCIATRNAGRASRRIRVELLVKSELGVSPPLEMRCRYYFTAAACHPASTSAPRRSLCPRVRRRGQSSASREERVRRPHYESSARQRIGKVRAALQKERPVFLHDASPTRIIAERGLRVAQLELLGDETAALSPEDEVTRRRRSEPSARHGRRL